MLANYFIHKVSFLKIRNLYLQNVQKFIKRIVMLCALTKIRQNKGFS